MIEIVFSESVCGSLKTAQHYGRGDYQSGCIGVIVGHADGRRPTKKEIKAARREAGERERTAWENAVPVGGNPADVYGFGLALSVGDIALQSLGIQRQRVLERLYTCFGCLGRDAALELMQRAVSDFNTVRERVAAGEALRRYRLSNFRTGKRMRRAASCKSPAGVRPRRGNGPPFLRCTAPPAGKRPVARRGESVPETLYDAVILREAAARADAFHEGELIGQILDKYRLGMEDGWLALRIEEMIRAGKLEAVAEPAGSMPSYHRMLRKRGSGSPRRRRFRRLRLSAG